jgi:hypothetical protein
MESDIMDWKKIIKDVDWGGSQGRGDRKKDMPDKVTNPFSKKKRPKGTMRVDESVPTVNIPPNKCDSYPDCNNSATKYCVVCCMKACDRCYPMFGGGHPDAPYNGDPSFFDHCNIDEVTGKGSVKEPKEDKYSTGKDW